jgi:hypothetical protein
MAISHIKTQVSADWTGTVTVFDSVGAQVTANASNLVLPSDWNSVHSEIWTLAGNTNGQSTAGGSNIVFGASGNVYVSGTSNSIIFSTPQVPAAVFDTGDLCGGFPLVPSANFTRPNSVMTIIPFCAVNPASFANVRFANNLNGAAFNNSQATSANTSFTGGGTMFYIAGLYSQLTGANSNSVTLLSSGTGNQVARATITADPSNGSNYSWTWNYSYFIGTNYTNISTTSALSTSNFSIASSVIAGSMTGIRFVDINMSGSLSEGMYWLVLGNTMASAGSSAAVNMFQANATNASFPVQYGQAAANMTWYEMGGNSSYGLPQLGGGVMSQYSSNSNTSLPASLDIFTDVQFGGNSQGYLLFTLLRGMSTA